MARLTDKQSKFVSEYLKCLNAAEAARLAGYSKKTARFIGHENLTKPNIKAEIQARMADHVMSADEVLFRLTLQARADMGEFIDQSDSELIENSQSQLIRKYKRTITYKRGKKDDLITERTEIELYDAQSALVHLGKAHGIFSDTIKVEDWRSQAIEDIKAGRIHYEALADAFDESLAAQLFAAAGIPVQVSEGADK